MRKVRAPTKLDQQMPADEIRQRSAIFDSLMQLNGPGRFKLCPQEHGPNLLKRSAVLKRQRSHTRQHIVQADRFSRTIVALHPEKDFSRCGVVMDTDIERSSASHANLLGNVVAA
jgi:hypothetical protein